MFTTLLPTLSNAINTYLDLDPSSKSRLQQVNGKIITIELLPFHFLFHCTFTDEKLILVDQTTQPADTVLRGTPLQMMGVMVTRTNRNRFFAEDLVIEGDAALGQQIIELFDELSIDWEEHASRLFGDIPVYHAGRMLNKVQSWMKRTTSNLSDDVAAYLHEETEWLPSREALHDFFSDIDTLSMDVERAAARIQHLETLIRNQEG